MAFTDFLKRLFLATGPGQRWARTNEAVDRVNDLRVAKDSANRPAAAPGRHVRLDSSSSSDDEFAWDNIDAVTFTAHDGIFVAAIWTGPPFNAAVYPAYWVHGDTMHALNAFAAELTPDVPPSPAGQWERADIQRAVRRMHRKGLKV